VERSIGTGTEFASCYRSTHQAASDRESIEVGRRRTRLFGGNPLVCSFVAGERLSEAQQCAVEKWITAYRDRPHDISWLMRCVNVPGAR